MMPLLQDPGSWLRFPSWPPGWDGLHPWVVHCPMTLFLTVPVFVFLAMILFQWGRWMSLSALVLWGLALFGAWLSVSTGLAARDYLNQSSVQLSPEALQVLEKHEQLASTILPLYGSLFVIYLVLFLLSIAVRPFDNPVWLFFMHLIFLILLILAGLVLINTGELGGRLVHEFGIRGRIGPARPEAEKPPLPEHKPKLPEEKAVPEEKPKPPEEKVVPKEEKGAPKEEPAAKEKPKPPEEKVEPKEPPSGKEKPTVPEETPKEKAIPGQPPEEKSTPAEQPAAPKEKTPTLEEKSQPPQEKGGPKEEVPPTKEPGAEEKPKLPEEKVEPKEPPGGEEKPQVPEETPKEKAAPGQPPEEKPSPSEKPAASETPSASAEEKSSEKPEEKQPSEKSAAQPRPTQEQPE